MPINRGAVSRFDAVLVSVTLIYGGMFAELLASNGTALAAESPCGIMKVAIYPRCEPKHIAVLRNHTRSHGLCPL